MRRPTFETKQTRVRQILNLSVWYRWSNPPLFASQSLKVLKNKKSPPNNFQTSLFASKSLLWRPKRLSLVTYCNRYVTLPSCCVISDLLLTSYKQTTSKSTMKAVLVILMTLCVLCLAVDEEPGRLRRHRKVLQVPDDEQLPQQPVQQQAPSDTSALLSELWDDEHRELKTGGKGKGKGGSSSKSPKKKKQHSKSSKGKMPKSSSSKSPKGKGKGGSSKSPKGKGKGGSSKSPKGKGKGGSSKSPKGKGKGDMSFSMRYFF